MTCHICHGFGRYTDSDPISYRPGDTLTYVCPCQPEPVEICRSADDLLFGYTPDHVSSYNSPAAAMADLDLILDERKAAGWRPAGGPHLHTQGGLTVLRHRFIRSA